MNDKELDIYFKVLKDKDATKEMSLMCILQVLCDERVSLHKAYELCEEFKLFNNPWTVVDAKITELYEKLFNKNK